LVEYTEKVYTYQELDENRSFNIATKGPGETHLRYGMEAGDHPSKMSAFQTRVTPGAAVPIIISPSINHT
jgi:hypothetical protein